jgi:hypothetical protein
MCHVIHTVKATSARSSPRPWERPWSPPHRYRRQPAGHCRLSRRHTVQLPRGGLTKRPGMVSTVVLCAIDAVSVNMPLAAMVDAITPVFTLVTGTPASREASRHTWSDLPTRPQATMGTPLSPRPGERWHRLSRNESRPCPRRKRSRLPRYLPRRAVGLQGSRRCLRLGEVRRIAAPERP